MKDKLKPIKPIEDNTSIIKPNPIQPIKINWNTCIICGLDLHKQGKTRVINGIKYTTFEYKKYYKLWDKQICWNCTFKLTKQFQKDTSH